MQTAVQQLCVLSSSENMGRQDDVELKLWSLSARSLSLGGKHLNVFGTAFCAQVFVSVQQNQAMKSSNRFTRLTDMKNL